MSKKSKKTGTGAEFPALAEKLRQALLDELGKTGPESHLPLDLLAGFPPSVIEPVLAGLAQEVPELSFPLLRELANHEDRRLALAAAEALGRSRLPKAAVFLVQLEEELLRQKSADAELRKAVARSLHRLRSVGLGAAASATARTAQLSGERQFHQALVSNSDSLGTIQAVLALRSPGGKLETAIILLNDTAGVIQTRLYTFSQRQYDNFLAEWKPETFGIRLVPIERDFLNHLVQKHIGLNRQEKRGLPPEFVYWQRHFQPPQQDYSIHPVYRQLSQESIQEALAFLLPQTEKLVNTPETRNWLLNPSLIRDNAEKLLERRRSRIVVSPVFLQEYRLRLAQESVEQVFTGEFVSTYIERLEHLAFIYLLSEQREFARLALAAALDLKQGREPAKNPFILALAAKSLDSLTDLLEGGHQPEHLTLDLSAAVPRQGG